jgi:hypothetical protein
LRIDPGANAGGDQCSPKAFDPLRGQLAKWQSSEMGKDVLVPLRGVDLERRPREIGLGIELPPLLGELRERLLAGVDDVECARSLPPLHLGIERLGVTLAAEDAGVLAP